MTVILILTGMVMSAILLVGRQVTKTQQFAEIKEIELALNDFKTKHGVFPPSRIRLREWAVAGNDEENQCYTMSDPFDAHSVGYLKRIWPDIKLPIRQSPASGANLSERPDAGEYIQWFVDASIAWTPQTYELEGDECLVLFLGGIAEKLGDTTFVMHGFTADPKNPSRIPDTATPRTIQRNAGAFTFRPGRLYQRSDFPDSVAPMGEAEHDPPSSASRVDFFPNGYAGVRPAVKLPSYRASSSDEGQPRPIVYFSSYEGRGYRPDDVNIPPIFGDPAEQTIEFQLRWPTLTYWSQMPGSPPPTLAQSPVSLGPNPYTEGPLSASATGSGIKPTPPFNPKTFQIILPGADGEYGGGGHPDDYDVSQNQQWTANEDNLTNFSDGRTIGDFYEEIK
jgi:general secretion pathway protein G